MSGKLVADVDTITSNLEPLGTAISDYSSAVKSFGTERVNSGISEIDDSLNSFIEKVDNVY